ncbi:unnamed protein product [Allacma fusca]|uniref:Uncharacterized protein n=1 Tax=Allacma fusca TaxID=39272 RepID=A0A8J2K7H9_9HEXA|nr:unnamed protein product [Allacma fusca]
MKDNTRDWMFPSSESQCSGDIWRGRGSVSGSGRNYCLKQFKELFDSHGGCNRETTPVMVLGSVAYIRT